MDIHQAIELGALTDEQINLSREYQESRLKSAEAKLKLDILLASNYLNDFRSAKKNLGYEMAILMMLEADESPETLQYYREYSIETGRYKGIERLLDAIATKISYAQSMMKYAVDGERTGK